LLAQRLKSEVLQRRWEAVKPPIVPLRLSGPGTPFFCVHPIVGVVFPYYQLSRAMAGRRPFFGIQSFGPDGQPSSSRKIEEMAAYYITAVRKVQPTGPYFLGGWSFGSWVAYEMACQLVASGEEIGFLGLIDYWAPGLDYPMELVQHATEVSREISSYFFDYVQLRRAKESGPAFVSRQQRWWWDFLPAKMTAIADYVDDLRSVAIPRARPIAMSFVVNANAYFRYRPRRYGGDVTLFRATAPAIGAPKAIHWGWQRLVAGAVHVAPISGTHMTLLRQPYINHLAEALDMALDNADARITALRRNSDE
jgi:thioesterase domain-containing protein